MVQEDKAIDAVKQMIADGRISQDVAEKYFPELKESEDERIRKAILTGLIDCRDAPDLGWSDFGGIVIDDCIDWLEKQGEQETDEWKEGNIIRHGGILALVIKGRRAMKSNGELFTVQYPNEWVKAVPNEIKRFLNELEKQGTPNPYSGVSFEYNGHTWGMCARDNGVDILCDKHIIGHLEKQGGQNKFANKEFTFKAIPRLLEMIQPTDRAKSYCQKLIDSLEQECYSTDAKIVRNCLKQMNGEKVAMATMDEQNHSDKIEPKFHEGEWITNGNYTWKIVKVKPLDYILQSQDGNIVDDTISYVDEQFHSFTIEDAKDGDVLVSRANYPFIFKKYDENTNCVYAYCGICNLVEKNNLYISKKDGAVWTCHCVKGDICPASKEQRDILFAKMEEAGYVWDVHILRLRE